MNSLILMIILGLGWEETPSQDASSGQTIWYVDWAAGGQNDGTSWADAFTDLHDAIAVAQASDEIWVAAGTYRPDRGTGDRTMSFEILCGASVYGGFSGFETTLEERDWVRHRTILSGDLNGDDTGNLDPAEVDPCCVEYGDCQDQACREKVGEAEHPCLLIWSPDCAYWAHEFCCDLCRPSDRCDNSDNVVRIKGVPNMTLPSVVLDGLVIEGGEASFIYSGEAAGGGAYSAWADVTVRNCVFQKNAGWYSGALENEQGALSVSNSQFIENGGMARNGPALAVFGSAIEVVDCVFLRNKFGAIQSFASGGGTYTKCSFFENGGISRAALDVIDGSAVVSDSVFIRNKSNLEGSAIYSGFGVLSITNSMFIANQGNAAAFSWSGLIATNCAFIGNSRTALGNDHGPTVVENCSLIHNYNDRPFSVGLVSGGPTYVRNSILWGNENPGGSSEYAQLNVPDDSHVDYSIIEGWAGRYPGVGTTGLDPGLGDADGPDGIPGTEDDDIRLAPGSPGINTGDPDLDSGLGETDLDGHARVLCGAVDIGAYEFGAGDFNCDQAIELLDHAAWPACMTNPRPSAVRPGCEAFDFNADSDIDLADYAYLQRDFVAP